MGADWAGTVLYPEYLLAALVLVVVVVDALFWPRRPSGNLGYFTLCGVLLVLSAALQEWTYGNSGTAFDDLVFLDTYATFFDILVLAVALCALLLALGDAGSGPPRGEYYPLLLLSTLGMMLTASAADLIVVYLGLELASLSGCGCATSCSTGSSGSDTCRRSSTEQPSRSLTISSAFSVS